MFFRQTEAFSLIENYPGYLVGSAEQGFLQLMRGGRLISGKKYMSISPCFRDDPVDDWHCQYFTKLELFIPGGDHWARDEIMEAAGAFFISQSVFPEVRTIDDQSYDWEYNGVELGSYYWRQVGGLKWACGTGLAQPRFNQVKGRRSTNQ